MPPGGIADTTGRHPRPTKNTGVPMLSHSKSFAVLALAVAGAVGGCQSTHKPEAYNRERPDVTEIHSRDRGLQSAEVVEASEKLASELLSLPEVTQSSRRLTVVFTNMED